MSLFEENERLISEIEDQIKKLGISELEEKIKAQEIENVSYKENICEGYNRVFRLKNRVLAVNEKIINEQETVRNRLMYLDNMCKVPCGVEYMDMNLNQRRYVVMKFYQELYEKYRENPIKLILLGLTPNMNGRIIKIENLEEGEKTKALALDEYLKLYSIQEQLETLIDCVKNIQYNYIQDK